MANCGRPAGMAAVGIPAAGAGTGAGGRAVGWRRGWSCGGGRVALLGLLVLGLGSGSVRKVGFVGAVVRFVPFRSASGGWWFPVGGSALRPEGLRRSFAPLSLAIGRREVFRSPDGSRPGCWLPLWP